MFTQSCHRVWTLAGFESNSAYTTQALIKIMNNSEFLHLLIECESRGWTMIIRMMIMKHTFLQAFDLYREA